MSLEERIRAAMAEAGLNMSKLAKAAGISRDTLYKQIRGEKDGKPVTLDHSTATAIGKALGKSTAWVLGETGPLVDTLSMAQEAAKRCVEQELVKSDARAWEVLRHARLNRPSIAGFMKLVVAETANDEDVSQEPDGRVQRFIAEKSGPDGRAKRGSKRKVG